MVRLQSQVIKGENADVKLAYEMLICVQTMLQVLYHGRNLTKQKQSPALWGSTLAAQAHPAT